MPGTAASGGRNAKDRQAHVLAGTFRDDRHGAHDTPDPPKGHPNPPIALEGLALDAWDRACSLLQAENRLTVNDGEVIYQYAQLFAETEARVQKQLNAAASAQVLEDNLAGLKGAELVQCFQEIAKVRQLESGYDNKIRQDRMALRQMLVELGLTPAARSRVKLPAKPQKSKIEQFMEAGTQ